MQSDGAQPLTLQDTVFHRSWFSFTAFDLMSRFALASAFYVGANVKSNKELTFTFATSRSEPGERTETSAVYPVTVGTMETLAQQGAVGAKVVSITA